MNDASDLAMYNLVKRISDVMLSFFGICLLFPLFVLLGMLIKVDSKGPVIYKGIRSGLHSAPFEIYKFRTMVYNAESIGGFVTSENDGRVTRVGRVFRKYKLDELPQLFNVLQGSMSIVGPRPEVPLYTNMYTGEEMLILTVRPGITDFSSMYFVQLAGVVGSSDDKIQFDRNIQDVLRTKNKLRIKYVKERSFSTDIQIIIKTFVKLFKSF
jgi:lipopolysaccharide/colanic/teichoic acid biosynthesis glycosyltransferase